MTYTDSRECLRRNVTSTDERHGNVTVRRFYEDGEFYRADIFNASGWRATSVKTERGIRNAIARLNARDAA